VNKYHSRKRHPAANGGRGAALAVARRRSGCSPQRWPHTLGVLIPHDLTRFSVQGWCRALAGCRLGFGITPRGAS
jgi:hypothetical protein